MSRIAFVTYSGRPEFTTDDGLAAAVLADRRHQVLPLCWDGFNNNRPKLDLIVLRSPWNYHLLPEAFLSWLDEISQRARVVNAPAMVRWNAHKRYLVELAGNLPVIPTALARKGDHAEITKLSARFNTERIIVKPAISASAYLTDSFAVDQHSAAQAFLDKILSERDALVQPFVDAIATEGEVSLMYFLGRFSHAVIKHPKAGDFRVQHELGGSITPYKPEDRLLSLCETALRNVPGREIPLYARVDVVNDPKIGWQLQELELIEPSLYLEYAPSAAAQFADAIEKQL
jgi:glutathione synthase/RimK-type ligase-like ATP-grasp enzyme